MHASREEMLALQHAVYPLTRAMAARLAQRRRRRNRGAPRLPQDGPRVAVVRRRARRAEVQATRTRRSPRSWWSPTSRGRWRASPASRCCSCTRWRASSRRCGRGCSSTASTRSRGSSRSPTTCIEAVQRVNTEADVVWVDGHSDYGHAFEVFHQRHFPEITPKTSIILLGDARNNYHASEAWVVDEMRKRGRHVYWLDPEPRGYWDTGDSIVSEYGKYCDGVFECRNLRQLAAVRRRHRRGLIAPAPELASAGRGCRRSTHGIRGGRGTRRSPRGGRRSGRGSRRRGARSAVGLVDGAAADGAASSGT